MEENPYEPTSTETTQQPVAPHTSAIRTEAWRGFKFGAKITCIVMTALEVFVTVASGGVPINAIDYLEIAQGIGAFLAAILMTSFFGGVAGSIIMALAAVTRQRRRKKD